MHEHLGVLQGRGKRERRCGLHPVAFGEREILSRALWDIFDQTKTGVRHQEMPTWDKRVAGIVDGDLVRLLAPSLLLH